MWINVTVVNDLVRSYALVVSTRHGWINVLTVEGPKRAIKNTVVNITFKKTPRRRAVRRWKIKEVA